MMADRLIDPSSSDEDGEFDNTLRPTSLDEMLGQERAKEQLRIAIKAALSTLLTINIPLCSQASIDCSVVYLPSEEVAMQVYVAAFSNLSPFVGLGKTGFAWGLGFRV